MKITIKDYSGHNPNCSTVKGILKHIEEKGECEMEEIFSLAGFKNYNGTSVVEYLIQERKKEFLAWFKSFYSIEEELKKHQEALFQLKEREAAALDNISAIEGLNPSRVYIYFKYRQKYVSDRSFGSYIDDALCSILALNHFEEGMYLQLRKVLIGGYQYHGNAERHYRIAIENGNNSLYKQIEEFLNRKPFIFSKKRCYEGFEFRTTYGESYKCSGFNAQGRIKFILTQYSKEGEKRKLLNFSNKEFLDYFKGKSII